MAGLLVYCAAELGAQSTQDVSGPLPFAPSQLEYPDYARKSRSGSDVKYCEVLLSDLKNGTNIKFLQPAYQAQTVEQLAQSKRFGRCGVSALITSVAFEPRVWESIKDLPKEEQQQYGTSWTMSRAFSLYEADIDRNPKNGKELILYGGGSTSNRGEEADYTYFVVPNLKTCEPRCMAQVYDIVHHQDATVGVMNHRGEALIYETKYYEREASHSLTFQRLIYVPKRRDPIFYRVCHFAAKDVKPNPGVKPKEGSGAGDTKP